MGRPSIDPELIIRMLVVGYVFAIRSERLICRELQVNLASAPDMISLLDHLVGSVQHRCRDFEAKRFGRPEIDHQLECGRLLNWYIA